MTPSSDYAYGDSGRAARRLELVARVFGGPTRDLLTAAVTGPPGLAVDLGCGPGYTTELLHAATGARRTVGLDASDAFLAAASGRAPVGVSYVHHDVRRVPFPTGPADVILARLLLAHLPDPSGLAAAWTTQLAPGGVLVLDELEFIRTTHPVLARYEEMTVAVVAARGGLMYAGPELAGLGADGTVDVRRSEVVVFEVATADAARMFALNLPTWRGDPAITSRWDGGEVDAVAAGLTELCESPARGEITWGLRQVVLGRSPLRPR